MAEKYLTNQSLMNIFKGVVFVLALIGGGNAGYQWYVRPPLLTTTRVVNKSVPSQRLDMDDIEAALELPRYKIEQNFQAIRKLQESQVEIQKQNAQLAFILDSLEKRVTKGGN